MKARQFRRRDRLSLRQARWTITSALILGLLFSFLQLIYDYNQESGRLQTSAYELLEILDQPVSFAAYKKDEKFARELLVGYFSYESVFQATIRDAEGNVLASQLGELHQGPFRFLVDLLFGRTLKLEKELRYQAPPSRLMGMGEVINAGTLEVEVDTYPTGSAFMDRAARILIAGLARNVALSLVLLWVFHRFLTSPFLALVNQLAAINPERPEAVRIVPPKSHERDEFGMLVSTTNRLLYSIESNLENRIQKAREAERLHTEVAEQNKRALEMREYQSKLELANTELQNTLEELKAAQGALIESRTLASLGGLVAGVAHELNTPVGVGVTTASYLTGKIKALEQAYRNQTMSEEDFTAFLHRSLELTEVLQTNMERAANLVSSFKQVAVDQSRFLLDSINLKEYLQTILRSLGPETKAINLEVAVDCPSGLVMEGYPGALAQVVVNLVQNSIRHAFTPEMKPKFTIVVTELDSQLEMVFEDNGKGIDPNDLPHIFEPFYTTRLGRGGTGLGLNILYSLVRQKLQGEVRVVSQLGVGTKFILNLPKKLKYEEQTPKPPVEA